MSEAPLWQPSAARLLDSNLWHFMEAINDKYKIKNESYADIHAFSIKNPDLFWDNLWDFSGVKGIKGEIIIEPAASMQKTRFFPQAYLNYSENMLKKSGDGPALIFRGENKVKLKLSWTELHEAVRRFQNILISLNIGVGDRVGAIAPNHPNALIAFLACASLGAIWSSCSPDFGVAGIVDRFGQIAPKLLIACDGYYYSGRKIDLIDKIKDISEKLPTIENIILFDYISDGRKSVILPPKVLIWEKLLEDAGSECLKFIKLPFDHPLYILYSSGTTGAPKCIVHRAGGVLMKHMSEHLLNINIKDNDRLFYFTTCGWMMWNWLVSGLGVGATLLLYDGSPFYPSERILFDYLQEEQANVFGTSAKYIDALSKTGFRPNHHYSLNALTTILSTGSPLMAAGFDYCYEAIKTDMHLASISGGTDICGCFVGGNPLSPVWRGEIQGPMLGIKIDVYDEIGNALEHGKGELVCTQAFPSMPLKFWNDPHNEKYHNAYFSRFSHVWCHGDFIEWTKNNGIIIQGRSDATLNPGGVRIGTAEIYAQIEHINEVLEAVAVGQNWGDDVRIILFVRLQKDCPLDEALKDKIRLQIRKGASPRHVPALILAVSDIPRTKSGKIVELAVRDIIHNREIKNSEALSNPECLDLYRNLPELARAI